MSSAAASFHLHDDTPREDHIVRLRGLRWDDYERLLDLRGDTSAPRFTYLRKYRRPDRLFDRDGKPPARIRPFMAPFEIPGFCMRMSSLANLLRSARDIPLKSWADRRSPRRNGATIVWYGRDDERSSSALLVRSRLRRSRR